jgi:hypothetical protein
VGVTLVSWIGLIQRCRRLAAALNRQHRDSGTHARSFGSNDRRTATSPDANQIAVMTTLIGGSSAHDVCNSWKSAADMEISELKVKRVYVSAKRRGYGKNCRSKIVEG